MDTFTDTKTEARPQATHASPAPESPVVEPRSPAGDARKKAEDRARNGANWFFWIAAMSIINSITTLAGSDLGFIIGLGITQLFDAAGAELGAQGVTFALSLLAAGGFVFFGVFARKQMNWAFMTGMILYALDGLLFLAVGDILSVGFHVFVLFFMFNGYRANKAL